MLCRFLVALLCPGQRLFAIRIGYLAGFAAPEIHCAIVSRLICTTLAIASVFMPFLYILRTNSFLQHGTKMLVTLVVR